MLFSVKKKHPATVEAIFKICEHLHSNPAIYNVGNDDWISVKGIADIASDEMGKKGIPYHFLPATSDGRGWAGDLKLMHLNISKVQDLGWQPTLNSSDAVRRTVVNLIRDLCLEG